MNKFINKQGVTFGDKHSFRDFNVYPKTKMVVQPPKVKEVYVEVAGADGDLDLTEALTGRPQYKNRMGTFEFTAVDRTQWDTIYSKMMNAIHGRKMRVVLDDDPYYYYTGRIKINNFKSSKTTGTITIDGEFEPYKKSLIANSEMWLWDPFNFEIDVARDYQSMVVDGTLTTTIVGSRMPVTPVLEVSSNMTVTFNDTTYNLTTGKNRIAGMVLEDGEYQMTFTGNGTVSVQFEVGIL